MSSETKNPTVFISHAHEDKDRFVTNFAEKLRGNGVDAWYDEWEMKLGDSLGYKIFDAINNCDYFIVVLSKNSINKSWVKEELNSALVQKIDSKIQLIPVIIDSNIDVPNIVKHLYHLKVKDISNYESEYKELLSDLFENSKKPPLGKKPSFVLDYKIFGLNDSDSILLEKIGDKINEVYFYSGINFDELRNLINKHSLSDEQILESIEVLESKGYLDKTQFLGGKTNLMVKITPKGFLFYAENFWSDFNDKYLSIISSILNDELMRSVLIHEKTKISKSFIIAVLTDLERRGYINAILTTSGMLISKVNGNGKRFMKELLNKH